MKMGEIFDRISELEGHEFRLGVPYHQRSKVLVTRPNGEWGEVACMVVKEDEIWRVSTEDGWSFKCGGSHRLMSHGVPVFARDLKPGMPLDTADGHDHVASAESDGKAERVYDLTLLDGDPLYVDSGGVVHHNTFTVTKELAGAKAESFKGGITSASALYKTLFMNNEPGKILIFDDLDTLFDDKESVNILKGALDSSREAEVSYLSNNTIHPLYYKVLKDEVSSEDQGVKDELLRHKIDLDAMSDKRLEVMRMRAADPSSAAAVLPNRFQFVSRVIFISNRYLSDLPEAILSRGGARVEINLTLKEIVARIERLLDKIDVPVDPGSQEITMKEKRAALDYLKNVLVPYGKIPKIDFRGFQDICRLASGNTPKEIWHRWASVSIMETSGKMAGPRRKR